MKGILMKFILIFVVIRITNKTIHWNSSNIKLMYIISAVGKLIILKYILI